MDINNFPDKLFTKKQLLEKFFPAIHKSTLERYMRDINKNDDFKEIISRPTSQMTLINAKGFFLYLKYKESQLHKWNGSVAKF